MVVEIGNGKWSLAGHCEIQISIINWLDQHCKMEDDWLSSMERFTSSKTFIGEGDLLKLGMVLKTLLWKDIRVDSKPLCVLQPVLFELCTEKNISVQNFLLKNGHITFQRWLSPILFEQWLEIADKVYSFPFTNEADKIRWNWNKWPVHHEINLWVAVH